MRNWKLQGCATPATKKISTLSQSLVPRFFLQVVFFLCGPCTFQSGPVGWALCLNIYFVYASVAGGYQRGFALALGHSCSLSSLLVLGRFSSGSFGLSVPFQSSPFRGLFFLSFWKADTDVGNWTNEPILECLMVQKRSLFSELSRWIKYTILVVHFCFQE